MKIIVPVILVFILTSCVTSEKVMLNDRVDTYLGVTKTMPGSDVINDPASRFVSLFGDLKQGAKEDIIRNLYADTFYFNDTF